MNLKSLAKLVRFTDVNGSVKYQSIHLSKTLT